MVKTRKDTGSQKKFKILPTNWLDRLPEHDIELELDVLYSIIVEKNNQHKINRISESDFYSGSNRKIFKICKEIINSGDIVDLTILRSRLDRIEESYPISNRINYVLTSQIDFHIKRLKEISALRKMQDIAYQATVMCTEKKPAKEIKNWQIAQLESTRLKNEETCQISTIDDAYSNYIESNQQPTLRTGFSKLDNLTGGFIKGALNVVASAQGVGKTTFILNILRYICNKLKKKVLYVTLEMSNLSIYMKLISIISGISFIEVMKGKKRTQDNWIEFDGEEWKLIHNSRAEIYEYNLHFLGEKEINTADIKAEIKELRNIDVIFIDYLQLLKPTFPGKSLYESTSNISRELKVLAMEFNIPFVVINSINRDYSNRNDYKPHISDLRNSGQLEYDADLVLMLHRPSMFREADTSKGEDKKTFENKAELIIAKNRFGESNLEIDFYFDGAKSSFKEQSS